MCRQSLRFRALSLCHPAPVPRPSRSIDDARTPRPRTLWSGPLGGPPDADPARFFLGSRSVNEGENLMTTTEAAAQASPAAVDTDKLMAFVFRAVDEVGATLNAALVVMGDKLGYYRDLAAHGPSTPSALAERTGTAEPYAREWLNAQAAGGYVDLRPGDRDATRCRPSRSSRSPTRTARRSCPASSRSRSAPSTTPRRSSRRRRAAPATAGTSTTPTSTSAASGSSARATTRTWSPSGCPRSTAWSTS